MTRSENGGLLGEGASRVKFGVDSIRLSLGRLGRCGSREMLEYSTE